MPSKLEQLQLQFRQRLKEEQMIKIHTDNQQKALSKVSRYNGIHTTTQSTTTATKPQQPIPPPQPHHSPIKKGSPGVDRSRPLPPISKEQPRNTSSSRSSPINTPVENVIKSTTINSRSKSVDLETRFSTAKPVQISRMPSRNESFQNGRMPATRNGYGKTASSEPKQQFQQEVSLERKPDQDLLSKLKQAELQRLKVNSKAREDTSPRNGFNGIISKSSSEQKKPVKSYTPAAAPSRPRPKPQTAATTIRRPAPAASKPNARTAQTSKEGTAPRKPPGPGQEQCNICGRNFNQDRIDKHTAICKKAAQKKVKIFDVTKMRVKGTEAEQFIRKGVPKSEPKAKKSDWRKKHSDFIEAIRQAKMVQQHLAKGGKVSDLPPPKPSDTSDYVPCPHCGRRFNEAVAERHIPKCKNITCNKKNPNPPRRK